MGEALAFWALSSVTWNVVAPDDNVCDKGVVLLGVPKRSSLVRFTTEFVETWLKSASVAYTLAVNATPAVTGAEGVPVLPAGSPEFTKPAGRPGAYVSPGTSTIN